MFFDDESGHERVLDLDERRCPRVLVGFARQLFRHAAKQRVSGQAAEQRLQAIADGTTHARPDEDADTEADEQQQKQSQQVFGRKPIGEQRGHRPHHRHQGLHGLQQQ